MTFFVFVVSASLRGFRYLEALFSAIRTALGGVKAGSLVSVLFVSRKKKCSFALNTS